MQSCLPYISRRIYEGGGQILGTSIAWLLLLCNWLIRLVFHWVRVSTTRALKASDNSNIYWKVCIFGGFLYATLMEVWAAFSRVETDMTQSFTLWTTVWMPPWKHQYDPKGMYYSNFMIALLNIIATFFPLQCIPCHWSQRLRYCWFALVITQFSALVYCSPIRRILSTIQFFSQSWPPSPFPRDKCVLHNNNPSLPFGARFSVLCLEPSQNFKYSRYRYVVHLWMYMSFLPANEKLWI